MIVRSATQIDAPAIASLYSHYVLTTVISFEEAPVSEHEMWTRVSEVQGQGLPWLVAESAGVVVGFAYASKWKARAAYRFSVECSVYVAPHSARSGIGTRLYEPLLAELTRLGLHSVIGGIALPNDASVALHEKLGFVKTAHFLEVGFKFGRWIDVGYWQRRL
ncbi:MAG: arsinothricin resistance N-acetyltransferase ArsN1 family B [Planctomycetota bacterium]|nr:arsinothricin resistance N-acetyltransferase ArsN1 family B [Planctomycetota bacterium]